MALSKAGGFVMAYNEPGKEPLQCICRRHRKLQPRRTPAPPPLPHGHGELILVVDDEAGICDMTGAS